MAQQPYRLWQAERLAAQRTWRAMLMGPVACHASPALRCAPLPANTTPRPSSRCWLTCRAAEEEMHHAASGRMVSAACSCTYLVARPSTQPRSAHLQRRPQRRQLVVRNAPRLGLLPQRRRLLLVCRRQLLELLGHGSRACRGLLLPLRHAGSLRLGGRRPPLCIGRRLRLALERRLQLLRPLRAAGLQAAVLRAEGLQCGLRLVQLRAGSGRLGLQRAVAAGQV